MAKNYLIRDGKGTAAAQRVRTTPTALQIGDNGTTWYTGTMNVDISEEADGNYLYATNEAIGSYGYRQNTYTTIRYHHPIWFAVYEWTGSTYRNFVRLFTVRKNCKKIFNDPARYRFFINKYELRLITDATQASYSVPKVWQAQWGEAIGDIFSIELSAIEAGTTSFVVEARSVTSYALPSVLLLRVYDSKTKIVNVLMTFTSGRIFIGYDIGLEPITNFNFYTYKGDRVSDLDVAEFSVHRAKASIIRDFIATLP